MKRLVQNLLRGRMATKEMNINCVCALIRDVPSFLMLFWMMLSNNVGGVLSAFALTF